ncbi:MAG TPA: CHRD domain-containing protein [Rhodocyclaceae bacterium]
MKITKALATAGGAALLVLALAGFSTAALAETVKVVLSGDMETPPVKTTASGSGTITVNPDKTVSGSVATTGVDATMAHIHMAPQGKPGPVIIPLQKKGAHDWAVPPGTKLTDEQYQAFKAGNLYVNVHSAAHKEGEIRGQLTP